MDKYTVLEHSRDPLWIIKLWLLIHGGDPAPDRVLGELATLRAISALAGTLSNQEVGRFIQEKVDVAAKEHMQNAAKELGQGR